MQLPTVPLMPNLAALLYPTLSYATIVPVDTIYQQTPQFALPERINQLVVSGILSQLINVLLVGVVSSSIAQPLVALLIQLESPTVRTTPTYPLVPCVSVVLI
jgi:hypothetical protein